MSITAIVPIKLQNERLPGKNVMDLGGRPLIDYCLRTLLAVERLDAIYVYCSSDEIADYLPQGVNLLLRPKTLDEPTSNFTQIFESFRAQVTSSIYVYAHATAPFIRPETIDAQLDAVIDGGYDSSFCAERIQDYLWRDGRPLTFDAQNVPRSQDLPVVHRETSGTYVFSKDVFEIHRRRIGQHPYIVELDRREAVDINDGDDFRFAQIMLKHDNARRTDDGKH